MKAKTIELILKVVIEISEILRAIFFNNNKDKEGKKNDNSNSKEKKGDHTTPDFSA